MRVLVTGANGFVGVPVSRGCMASGWHVRAATRAAIGSAAIVASDSIVVGDLSLIHI